LLLQIAAIHQLRLALSVKYVKLRNQRHRRVRQLLRQQQQQQQVPSAAPADASHPLEAGDSADQQQQGDARVPSRLHSGLRLHHHSSVRHPHHQHHHHHHQQLTSGAANPELMALAAAAEGVVAANTLAHMAAAQSSSSTATTGKAGSSSQPGSSHQAAPGATYAADSPAQPQQQVVLPTSPESDLATLQYMAFVYALRRVINRPLAVARCLVDE
jgi:hypothetical protein